MATVCHINFSEKVNYILYNTTLFFYSQVLDGGTQLIRMYRALLMLFGWRV